MLKPDVFLLMRYDFWPNHLAAIRTSGARLVLAAAVLRKGSPYFNPLLKGFYRSIFMLFDRIFTVSRSDLTAFVDRFNCLHAEEAGDPRFDQVWLRSRLSEREAGHLKPHFKNRMVLVGGSTWQPDEQILIPAWTAYREKISLVLVPHKVDPENIRRIAFDLEKRNIAYEKISALTPAFNPEKQVLLVDQTGYLAELYTVASIAYVGGGFGVNVHNTLEPAVYGIPVLFGPRYGNSPEAAGLLECGAARLVHDERELAGLLGKMIGDPSLLKKAGTQAGEFVSQRLGATAAIAGAVAAYCMDRKQEE
jgi:3-deoxy-D-manno-octulosonic-acid transferase